MLRLILSALGTTCLISQAQLLINEIRIDNPGRDIHYVEFYNSGDEAVDVSGLTYLVIGDSSAGLSGILESITPLGSGTVAPGDYLLLSDAETANYDLSGDGTRINTFTVPNTSSLTFENGDNVTHLLVSDFDGTVSRLTNLDENQDGTLDFTPWTSVLDAVDIINTTSTPQIITYAARLGFETNRLEINDNAGHIYRTPDAGPFAFGAFGTSLQESTVFGSDAEPLRDTPGSANFFLAPGLTVNLSADSAFESSSDVFTGTVSRSGDTSEAISVSISSSNTEELEVVAPQVTLAAGQTEAQFTFRVVDDAVRDGDFVAELRINAQNFETSRTTFVVIDDETGSDPIIFNEIYFQIDPMTGDANADGTVDTGFPSSDQFIELVNATNEPIDLTGFSISNQFGESRGREPVHTFADGTVLASGCAIVVFSDGDVTVGQTEDFGQAEVQSTGALFISNRGETLRLRNSDGQLVALLRIPAVAETAPVEGSLVRSTDGDGTAEFVSSVTDSSLPEFSPGTRSDGSPFCTAATGLTLTPIRTTVREDEEFDSFTLTVSIPVALNRDITVRLLSSDETSIALFDTSVVIAAGETSALVETDILQDELPEQDQIVTFTAISSGFLNATVDVTVVDDSDSAAVFSRDLVINEFDAENVGTDTEEFIELLNPTAAEVSLDNLYLVVFNGADDENSLVIDLSGGTISAGGYYVIGNSAVPSVDQALGGSLQNGPEGIALYGGFFDVLPQNDFGPAAVPGELLDAVVYASRSGASYADLATLLNFTGSQIPDTETESVGRIPNGTGPFVATVPTPGAENAEFVAPIDGFDQFLTENNLAGESAESDSDADEIPLFLEYALGLDPNAQSALPIPTVGQNGQLTLTYPKGAAAVAAGNVTYQIESSPDLVNFQSVTPTTDDEMTIELEVTATTRSPRQFYRIRASQQ